MKNNSRGNQAQKLPFFLIPSALCKILVHKQRSFFFTTSSRQQHLSEQQNPLHSLLYKTVLQTFSKMGKSTTKTSRTEATHDESLKRKKSQKAAKKVVEVSEEKDEIETPKTPKAQPPKSVVQRICKIRAGSRGFKGAAYKLVQDLIVSYAQQIFSQALPIITNRKGRTLTVRDLRVLGEVTTLATLTPNPEMLEKTAETFDFEYKNSESYIKKQAERVKKNQEKALAKKESKKQQKEQKEREESEASE